jgi:hypothetical protein
MNDRGRWFKYTGQGRVYLTLAAVFLGLVLVEGALFVSLSLLLISDPVTKWSVAAALVVILIGIPLRVLFAPLFTRHRLTRADLRLHYGLHEVVVPRELIRSALPVSESLEPIQVLSARADAQRGRAVACFSDHGQVLLALREPLIFPRSILRQNPPVDQILFNVDDRDALLAEIGAEAADSAVVPAERPSGRELRLASIGSAPAADPHSFALRTEALTRVFGGFRAVDSLTLRVRSHEIYGFLGLNGAGKTTTMKMLVGLLQPTEGKAFIAGYDVWSEPELAKGLVRLCSGQGRPLRSPVGPRVPRVPGPAAGTGPGGLVPADRGAPGSPRSRVAHAPRVRQLLVRDEAQALAGGRSPSSASRAHPG